MPKPTLLTIPMPSLGVDLNRPSTFIDQRSSPYARNVRMDYGYIGPRMGCMKMGVGSGTAMPFTDEIVLSFSTFYDISGTQYFLCITTTNIYLYDSSSDKWEALSVCVNATELTISTVSVHATAPEVTTSANHGLVNDDWVQIYGIVGDMGTDVLNGNVYKVTKVNDTKFTISAVTTAKTYTSGGKVIKNGSLNGTISTAISTCHMAHAGDPQAADYYFIISNGVDPVLYWTGGSNAIGKLFDTDGSTHIAQQVLSFKESLLLLGADSEPHKIVWSNTGTINEFDFTATNAGFLYCYDTPGEIQWGGLLGDYIGIAKDDSLGIFSYTGGTELFRYDTMVRGSGLLAPGMLAILKDRWLLITKENVEQWDGGNTTTPMGDKISSDIYKPASEGGMNWSAKLAARVLVDKTNTRANFYIPTGTSLYANKNFCYNWKEGIWEPDDLTINVTATGSYSSFTTTYWSSYSDDVEWDDLGETTWDDLAGYEGANVPMIGDENGYVYQQSIIFLNDGVTAIDQEFQTIDFVPDGNEYQDRWIRYLTFELEAKGHSVTVSYSTDEGTTWTAIATQTLTSVWARYKLDFSITARKIRFKLQNDSSGSMFYVRWLGARVKVRGARG